jgi:hypothetical protein
MSVSSSPPVHRQFVQTQEEQACNTYLGGGLLLGSSLFLGGGLLLRSSLLLGGSLLQVIETQKVIDSM